MPPDPDSVADAAPSERCLFSDPLVHRAVSFLEPVLSRAADAARVGPEAERWVNLVYLAYKVLQQRPLLDAGAPQTDVWVMHRRTVAELLRNAPASEERTLLLDLVDQLDESAAAQPASRSWLAARRAYAEWLEEQGLLQEALTIYALTTDEPWAEASTRETAQAVAVVARLYRKLARWESAERAYVAALELAHTLNDDELGYNLELGRALALTQRGNLREALAQLEQVYARTRSASASTRHNVAQDLGLVLERLGRREDALAMFLESAALAPDTERALGLLGNIAIVLSQLGHWSDALRVHEIVRTRASSWVLRTNAEIETLAALCRRDVEEFRRRRDSLLAQLTRMAPSMRIDCRFQIAQASAYLGEAAIANGLLIDALSDAAANGLHQWYFRLETACAALDRAAPPEPGGDPVADAPLERLIAGVRAISASVAADAPPILV